VRLLLRLFRSLESERRTDNMTDFAKLIEQSKQRHNIENRSSKTHPTVSVTVAGADYAIKFGYDAALLKKLKDAVPESERTWHKGRKVKLNRVISAGDS